MLMSLMSAQSGAPLQKSRVLGPALRVVKRRELTPVVKEPSDMQGLSKPLVLLAQPVQVIDQGMCTIGSGVGVRNRPVEAMRSSGPHKTVSR